MLIGMVADDLTGAADALAPFARRGFASTVGFEAARGAESPFLTGGDALAFNTATRDLPPNQRVRIVNATRRAARRLAALRPSLLFKKIDSTLRGHLRQELDALRLEAPGRLALVCPAFPAQSRTTQSGVLHIHNVPWTSTEFAPAGMFASLTVRAAFGMGDDPRAAEMGMGEMRQGATGLEAAFQQLQERGIETVFCDATQQADLDGLAAVILRRPESYLCVGSAGLARALADALPPPVRAPLSLETLVQPFINGRALVVVGSLHRASRRQAALLESRLGAPRVVIDSAGDFRQNMERALDQIRARFQVGHQVALLTTPDTPQHNQAQSFAWLPGSVARRAAQWGLRAGFPLDAVAISGGDTAMELCQAFGGTGLEIQGEWQVGVALARLRAEPDAVDSLTFDGLPILTKAGGFGDDLTLARCVGLL